MSHRFAAVMTAQALLSLNRVVTRHRRTARQKVNDMEDWFKAGIAAAHKRIEAFTYPLLTVGDNGQPDVIASCVFVKYRSHVFLVTAGHALLHNNGGLFTRGEGHLFNVMGQASISRDDRKDHFDIAAIPIDEKTAKENSIMALDSTMWATAIEVFDPHSRAISGYPISRNKQVKAFDRTTKTISGKSYTFFGYAEFDGDYERFEKSKEVHVGIELLPGFDEKGTYLSSPFWPPKGFSGGGAWLIPNLKAPNEVYLEGILIEGHKHAKRKFCFSTRIEHVVDFIRQTHTTSAHKAK